MADALSHMCPSQSSNPEVLEIPSTLVVVFDANDADLHTEGDLDISDVTPSGETDARAYGRTSLIFVKGA